MADITDYIQLSSIRAVVGVQAFERSDAVLVDALYLMQLQSALREIHPNLDADYLLAKAEPSPTVSQAALVAAMYIYAAYKLASLLADSADFWSFSDLEDSKTRVTRDPGHVAALRLQLVPQLRSAEVALRAAYGVPSTSSGRVLVGSAGLTFNPITGV